MVLQMLGLAACPESPVWLEWVGRGPEAQKARQKLLGAAANAVEASGESAADERGDEEATQPLTDRSSGSGSLSNSEQVCCGHSLRSLSTPRHNDCVHVRQLNLCHQMGSFLNCWSGPALCTMSRAS